MPIITVLIPDYIATDPGHPSHQSALAQLVVDALAEQGGRVDHHDHDNDHDDNSPADSPAAASPATSSYVDHYVDPWFTNPAATSATHDYNASSHSPAGHR